MAANYVVIMASITGQPPILLPSHGQEQQTVTDWGYVNHGRWWLTWQLHAFFPPVHSPLLSSVISSTSTMASITNPGRWFSPSRGKMLSFIPIVLAVFMNRTLQPHWVLTTTPDPGFSLLRVPWSDSFEGAKQRAKSNKISVQPYSAPC